MTIQFIHGWKECLCRFEINVLNLCKKLRIKTDIYEGKTLLLLELIKRAREFKRIIKKEKTGSITSKPAMAFHWEMGSTALSSKRFCRSESFRSCGRRRMRGSNSESLLAVRSNSTRSSGISTSRRSWSWKLVRSRHRPCGSPSTSSPAVAHPPFPGASSASRQRRSSIGGGRADRRRQTKKPIKTLTVVQRGGETDRAYVLDADASKSEE